MVMRIGIGSASSSPRRDPSCVGQSIRPEQLRLRRLFRLGFRVRRINQRAISQIIYCPGPLEGVGIMIKAVLSILRQAAKPLTSRDIAVDPRYSRSVTPTRFVINAKSF
jgi:hypothetical protein